LKKNIGSLKRVAESLYRNTNSGSYSAHFRCKGRVIKRSLKTSELAVAKRKLRDLRAEAEHIDLSVEGLTLRDLTARQLELEKRLSTSSQTKKGGIAKTIYKLWPGVDGVDGFGQCARPTSSFG